MPTSAASSTRTAAARFAPGASGNPAGRPKGSRNKATLFREALQEGEAEAIVRLVVAAALAGEKRFLHACFSLMFARPRGRVFELDVPAGLEGDSRAVLEGALRAVTRGEISPLEALDVARVIERRDRAPASAGPVSDLYSEAESTRPGKDGREVPQGNEAADAAAGNLGDPAGLGDAIVPAPAAPGKAACKAPVSIRPRGTRADLMTSVSTRALAA
jgi:hypothetical protein